MSQPNPLASTLSLTNFSAPSRNDEDKSNTVGAQLDTSAFNDFYEDGFDPSNYEAVSMPVDLEKADDENNNQAVLRSRLGPIPIRKRNQYLWAPTPYQADIDNIEELRKLNGEISDPKGGKRAATWRDRLDFVNNPETYTGSFMCQIPLPIHNPQQSKFVDLTFTLPKGCEDVVGFAQRLVNGNGSIKMSFTRQQLAAVFKNIPNLGKNDWSIIPYTIRIVELHANLPDDCIIQFSTARVSKDERSKGRQQWIRSAGAHNTSDGSNSMASAHSHVIYRNIHRVSTTEAVDLFIADDELYNSGDFHRWVNCDEDRIWQEFEDCRCKDRPKTLHIPCGPDDMIRCLTVLQGLAQTEHKALIDLSEKFDHPVPKITQNDKGNWVHEVSADAVQHLLGRTFEKIDKHKIMMRLEDVALTLSPLRSQGQQGMNDISKKANAIAKDNLPGRCIGAYYPEFMCRIQISYVVCDHPPKQGGSKISSLLSSSATRPNVSNPKKTSGIYSMPSNF